MVDEPRKSENEKADVSNQISELSDRITLYEKLQRQLLQMRFGTIFLLVFILCIFIFGLFHRFTHLNLKEVQNQALQRMTTAAPIMSRYLMEMGQRVLPVYIERIEYTAREKLPIFVKKATEEAEGLALYLKDNTTKRLNDGLMGVLESQGRYILRQFPELEDEAAVTALAENVRIILSQSLRNIAMDKLDAHLEAISSIQTKLDKIKEEIKETPERNVELKLLAVTLELIGKKLIKEIYEIERGQK